MKNLFVIYSVSSSALLHRMSLAACLLFLTPWLKAADLIEPPILAQAVSQGELPKMSARLPAIPSQADFSHQKSVGQYGGQMKMLMARSKDIRMMTVYGYSRLVAYNEKLELIPDILLRVDTEEGRIFTFHLRPGHRWSDGHPFTSEDFRYYWDDVANNKELMPGGPPQVLRVNQQIPLFEVLDEHTVRFTWDEPNPRFLPSLAGPRPFYLYRPAHYLRQFHPNYTDQSEIDRRVKEGQYRNWTSLHFRHDQPYKNIRPERPSLQPWLNTIRPPAERFVFQRNPYFHRVDMTGQQLPYIDEVVVDVVSKDLITAKISTGEADIAARGLTLADYTFLKQNEVKGNYQLRTWESTKGSELALFPNLTTNDPVWQTLNRNVRYRRALSMALNRHEINEVIFFGLANEAPNQPVPMSPLYNPKRGQRWCSSKSFMANRILDMIGLEKRNDQGIRLLPDGRPMELIIHTAGERTTESDILELVHDHFLAVGIKVFIRPSQRDIFRQRVKAGEVVMSAWWGLENAMASSKMDPWELAPTKDDQLQWPAWGAAVQANQLVEVDMPKVMELQALYQQWQMSGSDQLQRNIWEQMLEIHAEQVYSIGTVSGVFQPVVVSRRLHNVPVKAWYSWEPGALLGVFRPDTFFIDEKNHSPLSELELSDSVNNEAEL